MLLDDSGKKSVCVNSQHCGEDKALLYVLIRTETTSQHEGPGCDLLAWTNPASTMEKAIPPIAYRAGIACHLSEDV